jgi:hypothetical protein
MPIRSNLNNQWKFTRKDSLDEPDLLSNGGDGISDLVDRASQLVLRHPQMSHPTPNSRSII